jgi:predicted phosphate transport protein (TIGR00153 family)
MRFFKKEKEVVELVLRHLEITEECLSTATETVEAYLKEDTEEAKSLARQVSKLESEADMVRYRIRDKLYSGAYLPLLREDIYRLVESIDKLANAGEACCDFFLNQRPSIPEGLKGPFLKVSEESLGIVGTLKVAVQCFFQGECKNETVQEHTKVIDQIESRVDKLEWDLTKSIFTASLDHSQKIHLKLCLNSIVEVSDRAEDAADQLDLASLKSMV